MADTLREVAETCPVTRSVQHKGAVRSILAIVKHLELSDEQTLNVLLEVSRELKVKLT